MNSSFGLWFLSAIFLSGSGALYTVWQQRIADARATRSTIDRLDMEISFRIFSILSTLKEQRWYRHEIEIYATIAKGVRRHDVIVLPSEFRLDDDNMSEERRVLAHLQKLTNKMREKVEPHAPSGANVS